MCPLIGPPTEAPVSASHTRMVPSEDPEIMCRPSGEYAMDITQLVCPSRGSPTAAPVSASHIRMVLSLDPETICRPFGEQLVQQTALLCPIHSSGGAGHDNNFPVCILMALVNPALRMADKCDCDGRKGRVEIYVCGGVIEMGGREVVMKRQTSCIFSKKGEM